jgi:hypothetical protein
MISFFPPLSVLMFLYTFFYITAIVPIYVAIVLILGVVIRVIQCCNLLHICLTFNIKAFLKNIGVNLFSRTRFLSMCCDCVSVWSSNLGLHIVAFYFILYLTFNLIPQPATGLALFTIF